VFLLPSLRSSYFHSHAHFHTIVAGEANYSGPQRWVPATTSARIEGRASEPARRASGSEVLIPTECQRGDLSRILPTTGSEKAPSLLKQSFLWVASIASSDARSTSTGPLGSGCAPTGPGGYSPERLMLCLMTYHGQGVPGSR
jgi:hypothetical protein